MKRSGTKRPSEAGPPRRLTPLDNPLRNWLQFQVERLVQRGVLFQLLLIAAVIGAVAVAGGLAGYYIDGDFAGRGEAIWWAFLRLTDPGYLGDDVGTGRRVVSVLITVLGFVLFVGSLIAILTASLDQVMRRLESGLTPIAAEGHLLILGWTNRTPALVRELVLSEGRVARFLKRKGVGRLRIVILAGEVTASRLAELREGLGRRFNERQIILRSGSALRLEHLRRVDFERAAVIILPGADFALGGADQSDARVVKTLMSISKESPRPVPLVAEIVEAEKAAIVERAYGGEIDLIASDQFISRLIAQNVRHRGLSVVYTELLSYTYGNEVYIRDFPELAGQPLRAVRPRFKEAVVLGVVRPEGRHLRPFLNPAATFTLQPEDRLVLIARDYETAVPGEALPASPPAGGRVPAPPAASAPEGDAPPRRILILGWNHKVPALLREFESFRQERYAVDVLALVGTAEREAAVARAGVAAERIGLRQLEGDYTVRRELERHDLAGYDQLLLVASDWAASTEASDARTVLAYMLIATLLPQARPGVIVELLDPDNAQLFEPRGGEVIVSPEVLSHLLAHIALRRELNVVFGELFGPGGAEIGFRSAAAYGVAGAALPFGQIADRVADEGEILLGVRRRRSADAEQTEVMLNPGRGRRLQFEAGDELIVLTTSGG